MTTLLKTTCRRVDCTRRARHSSHGLCTPHWRELTRKADQPIAYNGAHRRVYRLKGPARLHRCIRCGGTASEWAYDHADPDEITSSEGPYSLDVEHYDPMCHSCHVRFDRASDLGVYPSTSPTPPEGKAWRAMKGVSGAVRE